MPAFPRIVLAGLVVALLIGAPLWYKRHHDRQHRNFRLVEDGVLYRSGQLELAGLQRLIRQHGIKTIVCLREGTSPEDRREEEWAQAAGYNYVRIPPRPWYAADGTVPAEIGLREFRAVMDDPTNHPVLVHCYAGIHRTGTYVAIHRMDRQGWTNYEAMNEMRMMGYTTLDDDRDVFSYLLHYRPHRQRSNPVPAQPVSRQNPPTP